MSRAEAERVLARLADALEAGEWAALAVVVGVSGSAYRRTGAVMALGDGWSMGSVSAGCLEADVRIRVEEALVDGRASTVEYDTGDRSPFGLGIGCGGRIRVAVVPLGPADAQRIRCQANEARGAGPFDFVVTPTTDASCGPGALPFRRRYPAPDWVHVYGAGADSDPLVEMAVLAGFRVAVVDHRSALLARPGLVEAHARIRSAAGETGGMPERAGRIFAVLKTHDLMRDRTWLATLRGTAACYLGLMGPLARVEEIIRDTGGPDPRIRAPVGLDLGGDGAWDVALSIVAEIQAVAKGRSGHRIRVILPAAGASSRMGPVDKRLLPWRGACLLVDGVRRATILDPVPIVVVRPGDRAVRETLDGLSCVTVVNTDPERGPVSSVGVGAATALERGAKGVVVILPDMPRVSGATLKRVAEEFGSRGEDVVITCDYGGISAPPVALPVRVLRTLVGLQGTVREALNVLGEARVSVSAPAEELFDIDTPEDWRELSRERT